jgi:hypothetical protein
VFLDLANKLPHWSPIFTYCIYIVSPRFKYGTDIYEISTLWTNETSVTK